MLCFLVCLFVFFFFFNFFHFRLLVLWTTILFLISFMWCYLHYALFLNQPTWLRWGFRCSSYCYTLSCFIVFILFFDFSPFLDIHLVCDIYISKIYPFLIELCRGYKRFFKRTALEASDYLKDDCLSINCSVGVVRSHTEGPKAYTIHVPPSNIAQHFGQLLESGEGTDVSFEVDGEIFSAHKLVLAARSPVFRAQLFGPMKEPDMQCIKVKDMQPAVFKVNISDSVPNLMFYRASLHYTFIITWIVFSIWLWAYNLRVRDNHSFLYLTLPYFLII